MATCDMVYGEDGDLNTVWFCSVCDSCNKDTRSFSKRKTCPKCNSTINRWIGCDELEEYQKIDNS
jgi:Zn finger protein HypA/HybF involved in hydrogenase expression